VLAPRQVDAVVVVRARLNPLALHDDAMKVEPARLKEVVNEPLVVRELVVADLVPLHLAPVTPLDEVAKLLHELPAALVLHDQRAEGVVLQVAADAGLVAVERQSTHPRRWSIFDLDLIVAGVAQTEISTRWLGNALDNKAGATTVSVGTCGLQNVVDSPPAG
jgi:hypothetical protein